MHYEAVLYNDSVVRNRIMANSIDVLKSKCEPWIEKENITMIEVVEVKNIGFFKVPEVFEEALKNDML